MKGVAYILKNDTNVTDKLNGGSDSVFLLRAEQSEQLPYVIIDEAEVSPNPTKTGTSTLDEVQTRVFVMSDRIQDGGGINGAIEIAEAVRLSLDNVSGTYDTEVLAGIEFESEDFYVGGGVNNPKIIKEQIYQVFKRR